ncbi:MAG: hypothetical protein WCW16_03870 [Candidatus Magasanikbacteria bacterium]
MKHVQAQLKMLKQMNSTINPDQTWVVSNKQRMMNQIGNTVVCNEDEKKITTFEKTVAIFRAVMTPRVAFATRSAFTVFLALLMTTAGWIASAYAEPGDVLWNAKSAFGTVVEQGQLALTSQDEETSLRLQFATKRAEVLKKVADTQTDTKTKSDLVKKAVKDLEQKLDSANESLKVASSESASGLIKEVALKTQEISNTIKETAQKVSQDDKELGEDLDKKVIESQAKGLEMVETAVQKKTGEGQQVLTEDEKVVIKEHISGVVEGVKQEAQKVQDKAQQLVTDFGVTVSTTPSMNITSTIPVIIPFVTSTFSTTSSVPVISVSTSTIIISASTTSAIAQEVLDKTQLTINTVEAQKTQMQQLVETDNVLQALQQTKDLTQKVEGTVQEIQRMTSGLPTTVANTAPVVTPTTINK